MHRKIVFIDDDPIILRTLQRVFLREPYDCSFFESGKDALIHLEKNGPPDILITDMLMPEMNGVDVLKAVKKCSPSTIRGILSGFTDNKTIVRTLMGNLSHFYLNKPWNNRELQHFIARIISLKETLSSRNLRNRMKELEPLPLLPELYRTTTRAIREESPFDEIINRISENTTISETVLQIANSAFCGENIGSIKEAVEKIGLDNVHLIIFMSEIVQKNASQIKEKILWNHAILTNRIVNHLYIKKHSCRMPINTGSVGLLHTIGLILLLRKQKDKYNQVLHRKTADPNLKLIKIEWEIFGIDHMNAGAFLLNHWGISIPYIEAALYYRNLSESDCMNHEIVELLHIASHLAWRKLGQEIFNYPLELDIAEATGYPLEEIEKLIRNCDS